MGAGIAWLLNLGAEVELSDARRTLGGALLAKVPALSQRIEGLVGPSDRVLFGYGSVEGEAKGMRGRAWIPTPRALGALMRAGAELPLAPSYEVLRDVNDRRFSLSLGPTLPGQCAVTTIDSLLEAISMANSVGNWLLRRPHGFSGRGRRRVRKDEVLSVARPWIEASLREFGVLLVEPWKDRVQDFGLHGFISRNGELSLGTPTSSETTGEGAWVSTRIAEREELSTEEEEMLRVEAEKAGNALFAAGYFGPFGVDAFRYRDERGFFRMNPRCEINARYSMGWGVGMGSNRPDLER